MALTTGQKVLGGLLVLVILMIVYSYMSQVPSDPALSVVPGWQTKSSADVVGRLGGNSETPETCKKLAQDGGYIAWGYRDATQPEEWRNTCFAYRTIIPFAGTNASDPYLTGCTADGKYPINGCK